MSKKRATKPVERDPQTGRIYFDSIEEIPEFACDEEELAWLNSHTPSIKFFDEEDQAPEAALQTKRVPRR